MMRSRFLIVRASEVQIPPRLCKNFHYPSHVIRTTRFCEGPEPLDDLGYMPDVRYQIDIPMFMAFSQLHKNWLVLAPLY